MTWYTSYPGYSFSRLFDHFFGVRVCIQGEGINPSTPNLSSASLLALVVLSFHCQSDHE
jgi:hypothetical protein